MLNSSSLEYVAEQCKNQTQGHERFIFVVVYALVFVSGLILNFMALIVFFFQTKSRSHTIIYMTNLALADLLLVCTLPLRIYHYFHKLPQKTCEIAGLILLVNMYGSIFLLTCVSLDRCLAVCFPMSSRVREGRKKAPLVCVGIWMLTIGASLPMYLAGGKNKINKTGQEHCFRSFPYYAIQTPAMTSSIVIGFGIPLVIMVLCSWGLVQAIRKSAAAQTDGLVNSRKIQKMISTNLAIFLLCFLPYHLMLAVLYSYNKHTKSMPCAVISAYQYSLMTACLNAALDPLAYYFTTETFRKNVDIDFVWRMWPMNSHSSDGTRSRAPLNT
ncbi:lysophosphatidic acid receptor 6 [Pygocentrus nattereri]|uniref:lysophosphatidic acid receptor 6 n=1 Tax=Pygocentrus nattereri TaxID=42514 RepID=UPI0008146081|nr:lysophosphatidic acid receptor 6 [Pygocentrus nattereri]XP_017580388.1 lysophosphatidic acid receptor 6 [Pygocentrus nattereri]